MLAGQPLMSADHGSSSSSIGSSSSSGSLHGLQHAPLLLLVHAHDGRPAARLHVVRGTVPAGQHQLLNLARCKQPTRGLLHYPSWQTNW
jgi:hypothetical protein